MLRFDKATCSSFPFKFILSVRLSNSLWGSDGLLFLEFTNPFCFITLLNSLYCCILF